MSRPKLKESAKRSTHFTIPVNRAEREAFIAAAKAAGMPTAMWMRNTLMRAAKEAKQ